MSRNLFFILCVAMFSCSEPDTGEIGTDDIYFDNGYNVADKENMPIITFEEDDFNFGMILAGEKVTHTYKFQNTGKRDLILANVSAECGCTVPKKFSREPIKAGETGEVFIEFDSTDKLGPINKKITVVTNSIPNRTVITISGEVLNTDNLININQE